MELKNTLAGILCRSWWMILLRGLVAIGFGILTWRQPGLSLGALILLFGIFSLADGVLGVWTAITGRKDHEHWGLLLLGGLVGIGIGLLTFLAPGLTALALLFYIAIWAIATGLLQIAAAVRLRKEIKGEWLLILGGLASVLFGAFLISRPGEGALAVISLIAIFAVVFGITLVMLAFKVRGLGNKLARAA